jgi:hypothetical protein
MPTEIPLGILSELIYSSDEESYSAITDGRRVHQLERGQDLLSMYANEDEVKELRRLCAEISVARASCKLSIPDLPDNDFKVGGKRGRPQVKPTEVENAEANSVQADAVGFTELYSATGDSLTAFVLDLIAMKNTYFFLLKKCIAMTKYLDEVEPQPEHIRNSLTRTDDKIPVDEACIELSDFEISSEIGALYESYGLALYNISLEYHKGTDDRIRLQKESLSFFSKGISHSFLSIYLSIYVLIFAAYSSNEGELSRTSGF